MSLSTEANERLYDALAEAIDRVGSAKESLFLTKLVLLLANHANDEAAFEQALGIAMKSLAQLGKAAQAGNWSG